MADAPLPPPHSWVWICPACRGMICLIRDTFQGRRLLAILVREAEATAEELLQQGTLRLVDMAHGLHWTCCCDDHGPTLPPDVLAQRQE
jgi:hypothetical protein